MSDYHHQILIADGDARADAIRLNLTVISTLLCNMHPNQQWHSLIYADGNARFIHSFFVYWGWIRLQSYCHQSKSKDVTIELECGFKLPIIVIKYKCKRRIPFWYAVYAHHFNFDMKMITSQQSNHPYERNTIYFERQFSYHPRSRPKSNPHHHILRYSSVPPRSHSKTLQSCSIPAQSPQRQQASRARSNKCIGSKSNSHIMATSCGENSTPSHEFN